MLEARCCCWCSRCARAAQKSEAEKMTEAGMELPPGAVPIRFRARYAETDAMGIVHHSRYIPWLEMGRTEFIRAHGYTYRELEEAGVLLAVVELHARYRAPARYDDPILVTTRLAEFGRVKLRFAYQVYNEANGQLLIEAETVHAYIGRDGRPIRITSQFPAIWARLQAVFEQAQAATGRGGSDGPSDTG